MKLWLIVLLPLLLASAGSHLSLMLIKQPMEQVSIIYKTESSAVPGIRELKAVRMKCGIH